MKVKVNSKKIKEIAPASNHFCYHRKVHQQCAEVNTEKAPYKCKLFKQPLTFTNRVGNQLPEGIVRLTECIRKTI